MKLAAGRVLGGTALVLSAFGYPLTEAVIRRWGVRGAVVSEAVCIGLLIRDSAIVASGAPGRLRTGPAMLLWMELASAALASMAGLGRVAGLRQPGIEMIRRTAVGALFGLHTVRFWIYLQPDRGRRIGQRRSA